MPLFALSTGHKVGLALIAAAFILFALVSSFLLPRWRPQFPGRGGLPFFIFATVALFAGMMTAVVFLAREPKEAAAGGGQGTAAGSSVQQTAPAPSPGQGSTATKTTSGTKTESTAPGTTNAGKPLVANVSETEFKITVAQKKLTSGSYTFVVANKGKIDHNLVVKGPNASGASTPTISAGKSTMLTVSLTKGTYELYCSLPGHKQAGMDLRVSVG